MAGISLQLSRFRLPCYKTSATTVASSRRVPACRAFSLSARLYEENYYELLGVTPQATADEIKAAYFKMSRKFHPDVNKDPDAVETFTALTTAYEVLGNKKTRRLYDAKTLRTTAAPGADAVPYAGLPTKYSYGAHMRHPEYLTTKVYHREDHNAGFYNYHDVRRRLYADYIYDRTASPHAIVAHRDRLNYQSGLERGREHFVVVAGFVMFAALALLTLLFSKLLEQKEAGEKKKQYRFSFRDSKEAELRPK